MRSRFLLTGMAAALVATGCSDATSGGSTAMLAFATRAPAPGLAPRAAGGPSFSLNGAMAGGADTTVLGADTIIITRAALVLRQIELKGVETSACDTASTAAHDSDGCEEFTLGPQLFEMPLGPGSVGAVEITILPGTYDELEFEIHRLESGSAADQAIVAAHPEMASTSIRVEGTWNGTPFVYQTELEVEQELNLVPPIVVGASGATTVVLQVTLSQFFANGSGTGLVNPATANKGGANESLVNENIKRAFESFEDHS